MVLTPPIERATRRRFSPLPRSKHCNQRTARMQRSEQRACTRPMKVGCNRSPRASAQRRALTANAVARASSARKAHGIKPQTIRECCSMRGGAKRHQATPATPGHATHRGHPRPAGCARAVDDATRFRSAMADCVVRYHLRFRPVTASASSDSLWRATCSCHPCNSARRATTASQQLQLSRHARS